jgi:hypothetical protein
MHFAMKMILVIDEPKVFDAWYNAQQSWLSKLDRDNPHLARNSK